MQISQRIESVIAREPSSQAGSVREVTLIFVSKPQGETSQHVYVLRQELPRIDSMMPLSYLDHVAGPNALLALGGLMLHDRAQKKITLSNHLTVYYQHLIFFSHSDDSEVRAPALSAGTLYSLLSALRSQEIRPNASQGQMRQDKARKALASMKEASSNAERLSFLEAFCNTPNDTSENPESVKKNRCIFEIQP